MSGAKKKKVKAGSELQGLAERLALAQNTAAADDDARTETLSAQVYRVVREALLSGILAPGDLLSSRIVAEALGTSPMPVREALGRLMIERALESTPNRAFRVPYIDLAQFRQLLLMRLRLETLAGEHAATRLTPSGLATLARLMEQLAQTNGTALDYLPAHRAFHFEIYRHADMPLVYSSIETLWLRMGPLMNAASGFSDLGEEFQHHRELYRALERADSLATSAAVQNDLMSAGRRVTEYLQLQEASGDRFP
jgi:DNA-binding GntR family transcriptional regulator